MQQIKSILSMIRGKRKVYHVSQICKLVFPVMPGKLKTEKIKIK